MAFRLFCYTFTDLSAVMLVEVEQLYPNHVCIADGHVKCPVDEIAHKYLSIFVFGGKCSGYYILTQPKFASFF